MHQRTVVCRVVTAVSTLALLCPAGAADEGRQPDSPSTVARHGTAVFVGDSRAPGLFRCDDLGRCALIVPGSAKQRTPLYAVSALAVDRDGTVFAADRATGEVYRVEVGKPPVPLSGGAFEIPTGLAIDPSGRLVISDLRLGIVARLPRGGGRPETVARVPAPRGVAIGHEGNVFVLSMGPDQLVRLASDGTAAPLVGGKPFRFPLALARDDKHARWLVSDGYARTIWAVDDAGKVSPWAKGDPLVRPSGLSVDSSGALFVADPGAGRIFRITGPDQIDLWPQSK